MTTEQTLNTHLYTVTETLEYYIQLNGINLNFLCFCLFQTIDLYSVQ